jgi:general stress protein 26
MIDDIRTFLEQPQLAYLSTIDLLGYPHTVPVWFALDGDDLIFSTQKQRVRLKHIQANTKGAVVIGGEVSDGEGYLLQGKLRIEEDINQALRYSIIYRYMSGEAAEQFIAYSNQFENRLVRLTPTKIVKVR